MFEVMKMVSPISLDSVPDLIEPSLEMGRPEFAPLMRRSSHRGEGSRSTFEGSTLPAKRAAIDLFWLPLGAGGRFVRFNGRVYEAIHALLEHRRPLDLYHTALEVTVPEGCFVIENCWPVPDASGAARGVTVQGPVVSRLLGRYRPFHYEIRCWNEGVIADIREAVASPQRISDSEERARRLLELVGTVPPLLWGRDELAMGEMWNSNSVISWLLTRSGVSVEEIQPPSGGRAPGWATGIRLARHFGTDVSAHDPSLRAKTK